MRRFLRTVSLFTNIAVTAVMSFVVYLNFDLPDRFYVSDPAAFSITQHQEISVSLDRAPDARAGTSTSLSREASLKLFGLIPIKTTYLNQVKETYVVPCGTPFGLKMLTEGVVVVGLNPVETALGSVYPAETAGMEKGDVILAIDGQPVSGNKELTARVRQSGGKALSFSIRRGDELLELSVTPAKGLTDGEYRCGIWVRDSSAGIGTVTFYEPVSGIFGGLGHAVCDVDTGEPMPLSSGEVVPVHISGVRKGQAGAPGELQGSFLSNVPCGRLYLNNETGVYGTLDSMPIAREAVPLCFRQDVAEGPAKILATVDGSAPEFYDITIEKVHVGDETTTKNMVIRITDSRLLAKTGGIVQGMSGSPILQDGKLVGAVTHVLINDPTRGYGIFSENMLDNYGKLQELLISKGQ